MIGDISTTFSKFPDSGSSTSDMIFNALGLVYTLASGPLWGTLMKDADKVAKDSADTKKI
ncbi:hypothetical protein BO94DRAFT_148178 [Aspergillus sclerotioniger CBS 115572]|uniref:Uncharacterized protein n=1 Tax=Aspergillus sclerotioniger CBS 115572 TaxID=1450535 RepID=A0A317W8R2_9EURO|nr:hypothetical protein BO94DRAFT_148178 [Aspergillus sclerotioniger CBS 115572]PWY81687.1 hypothetical protein BO94DRAFT_148178 [Aspergillus sclerotioniger CBS 115572]